MKKSVHPLGLSDAHEDVTTVHLSLTQFPHNLVITDANTLHTEWVIIR